MNSIAQLLAASIPVVFLVGSVSVAQMRISEPPVRKPVRAESFGFGGGLGIVTYSGDVDGSSAFPNGENVWKVSVSATIHRRLFSLPSAIGAFGLRGTLAYTPMGATSQTYDFRMDSFTTSLCASLEFIELFELRPFIFAGAGFMYFSPSVTLKTPQMEAMWPYYRSDTRIAGLFPLGIGLVWTVGKTFDVYYHFTKTITTTDNLDGWVSNVRDNYQEISFGLIYYPLSER